MVNQKLYSQHGRTEQYLGAVMIGPLHKPVMAHPWWGYCLISATWWRSHGLPTGGNREKMGGIGGTLAFHMLRADVDGWWL